MFKIHMKPFGSDSAGNFAYRINSVDFMLMEANLNGEAVSPATPGAEVHCIGTINLRASTGVTVGGTRLPDTHALDGTAIINIIYDGETTYTKDREEIDLEPHEKDLIHACFQRFAREGFQCNEVVNAIRSNKKIQAIKAYRIKHGVGLKQAKCAVESMWNHVIAGDPDE